MPVGITDSDRLELRRIRKKLDSISGPGVRHTRESIYIGGALPERAKNAPRAAGTTVIVGIGGAITPGGMYFGTTLTWRSNTGTGDPNPATEETNAAAVVAAFPGEAVYFMNGPEFGLDTHDLVAPTGEAYPMGIGIYSGVTFSDGRPLVIGIGINWSTCSDVTDAGAFSSF